MSVFGRHEEIDRFGQRQWHGDPSLFACAVLLVALPVIHDVDTFTEWQEQTKK